MKQKRYNCVQKYVVSAMAQNLWSNMRAKRDFGQKKTQGIEEVLECTFFFFATYKDYISFFGNTIYRDVRKMHTRYKFLIPVQ